ncbi:T9SS type A sorting domain-containing protein [Chryseobacterium carnipullorum]|uniref:T9SS type A sorting domain-containing protein n=1 Tax=Chryseobacterium carnipullorum TaxID=1124835 RepID=UPI000E977C44|nr:T9SS type A sorting domain-containing protein [Chryseobacterium carnipullorum]HBV16812.1 hypothetical protein [Chryseobacterium carnipullorum]
MKKIITTGFAFFCALCSAQITLTKDVSFGNNGTVQLGTTDISSYHLSHYNAPIFQGNKLFVNQPIYDASGSLVGRKFYRLNHNGSLDATFGTNGEVTVPTTNYNSNNFYADTNKFYLDSGEKYFSNGLQDTGFGNVNTPLANNDLSHYKIVLPDGKIIARNPQNIKKYLSTGAPDTTYGNNGVVALDPSLEFTLDKPGGLKYFDQNFLYEVVLDVDNLPAYIRKINITTGNLDLSYGQNGNSYFYGTLTSPIYSLGSAYVPQSNALFIHNTDGTMSGVGMAGQLTRTNAVGILDTSFGVNGVINYPSFHTFNGDDYIVTVNDPILYENYIFILFSSFDNATGDQKFELMSYDYSGNPTTINNNLHHIFQIFYNTNNFYKNLVLKVKDNYLYAFAENKISRYIISNATLSTSENIETKESLQFINPFQNELNFNSKEKIKSIEIYDETGRLVLEGKNSTLDTSALERGVYMIKITMQSNKVVSKKGIKN